MAELVTSVVSENLDNNYINNLTIHERGAPIMNVTLVEKRILVDRYPRFSDKSGRKNHAVFNCFKVFHV